MTDRRKGDVICSECGYTLPERLIDPGQEWRDFVDSTDDKSRVSMTNEFLKDGLGTSIAATGAVGKGMSKIQNRLINTADRNLLAASEKIDNISNLLTIPDPIQVRLSSPFVCYFLNNDFVSLP